MLKRNIYLMYAISCLQGMVFYGPVATLYRQTQGVTVFEITLIESISLVLCLLLELPWGIAADKIGYQKTMIVCCLLYFLSKIIFWRADDFASFLTERVLLSIVIAGLSGVDTSVLYLSSQKGDSQKVFGIYNGLGTAGLLAAALIYSSVIGDDYRLAGLLTVVSYGIAALFALFLTEVKEDAPERTRAKDFYACLRQTLSDKYLFLFLLGTAFLNETHQTVTVFLNQLLYIRAGISHAVIGYLYIIVTIVGMCGVFSSAVTRKKGQVFLSRACFLSASAACVLLALTDSAVWAVSGILILRTAFGLFAPLQTQMQNERITAPNRAAALSINAVMIDSVGAGTNLVFGALAQKSLTKALLFGALLCACGALLWELPRHTCSRRSARS